MASNTANAASRKYLCAAPRPPEWEDTVEVVLHGFGGRREEALRIVRQTLEQIESKHGTLARQGPGRKSNAEHAFHFYEYLAERLEQEGEEEDGNNYESAQDSESSQTPVANGGGTEENSSMNTEEFDQQHNDLCEVCDEGGKVLMCSTCNLVFHLSCVRPVLEDYPRKAYWRCAYCILQTEPKNSRKRRDAASAVRLMARLRNGNRRRRKQQKDEEDEDDEEEEGDQSASGEFESAAEEKEDNAESNEGERSEDTSAEESDVEEVEKGDAEASSSIDRRTQTEEMPELEGRPSEKQSNQTSEKATTERKGRSKKIVAHENDVDSAKTPAKSSEAVTAASETDLSAEQNHETESATPSALKKRSFALFKLADAFTGQVPGSSQDGGRGKRQRKQPTLYDPQLVPARNWQSDSPKFVTRATDLSSDGESDNEEGAADNKKRRSPGAAGQKEKTEESSERTEAPANSHRQRGFDGEILCSFCGDDKSVMLCCFCGCRKCFGKHQQEKLLLCDECDDEYHMFCLEPRLTAVPAKKWYCPPCASSRRRQVSRATNRAARGKRVVPQKEPSVRKSSRVASEKSVKVQEGTGKRPRGRPPKSPQKTGSATGRKRGRPPKASTSVESPTMRMNPPKRSPDGRFISPKPESESKQYSDAASRTSTISASRSVDSTGMSIPVHVSRSGRTVKRSSFHDEIVEGEQHLKSSRQLQESRYSNESQRNRVPNIVGKRSTAAHHTPMTVSIPVSKPENPSPSEVGTLSTADGVSLLGDKSPAGSGMPFSMTHSGVALSGCTPTSGAGVDFAMTAASASMLSQTAISVPFLGQGVVPFAQQVPVAGFPMFISTGAIAQAAASFSGTSSAAGATGDNDEPSRDVKVPRRKPGARECMQISRRFGVRVIPQKYIEILMDYCKRGKVEHLIRMRERLDEHSRFLEAQLAGLETLVKEKGESNVVVPPMPEEPDRKLERTIAGDVVDR